jgi:hypothetical protein
MATAMDRMAAHKPRVVGKEIVMVEHSVLVDGVIEP